MLISKALNVQTLSRKKLKGSSILSHSVLASLALASMPISGAFADVGADIVQVPQPAQLAPMQLPPQQIPPNSLPQGPQLIAGSAQWIYYLNHLIVTQGAFAAINWLGGFNIAPGSLVEFIGPENFISLNRDTSGQVSQIWGQLKANGGTLILINPNGMIIGAGANINAGNLILTTADTNTENVMNGHLNFNIAGNPGASIVNHGTITAADGGLIAMVAPQVVNYGLIQAKLGQIILAGAEKFVLDFYGDGLYSIALDNSSTAQIASVTNHGTISAQGGNILLTVNAANQALNSVINTDGIIEATNAYSKNGIIHLDGGGKGKVKVSGKVDASGKGAGQTGGNITILGESIELVGANIDASGYAGGGNINIGGIGHTQGSNYVTIDSGSILNASAINNGNGGNINIWSELGTHFAGTILSRGGEYSGNGGDVEISAGSNGYFYFDGVVNLSAANGANGTLLIDPTNVTIWNLCGGGVGSSCVSVSALLTALNFGNVFITATNDITILSDVIWNSVNSFFASAGHDIIVLAQVISNGAGSIIFDAGNDITIGSLLFSGSLQTNTGNVSLTAGDDINLVDGIFGTTKITTASGDVSLTSGDDVRLLGGAFINSGHDLTINNGDAFFSDTAGVLNATNNISLNQSQNGSIQNAINAIGAHNYATLNLGIGNWFENIFIGLDNFTLHGSTSGNSTIHGDGVNPVITISGTTNNIIDNLDIDAGGADGIVADNTNNLQLNFNHITNATNGITVDNSVFTSIFFNTIDNVTGNGISLSNVNQFGIGFNTISNVGQAAIALDNSSFGTIGDNTIDTAAIGILATNSNQILINNNTIIDANIGIDANTVSGLSILSNSFNSTNPLAPGDTAIRITDSDGALIVGNNIQNVWHGIQVFSSDDVVLANNTFDFISGNAILANNSHDIDIIANIMTNTRTGVRLNDSDGALVMGNIMDVGHYGVIANNSDNLWITGNTINANLFDGVHVANSTGLQVENNTITTANQNGISLDNVTESFIHHNTVDAANNAVDVKDSLRFYIHDNTLTAGNDGIHATDSDISRIHGNTIFAGNDGINLFRVHQIGFYNNQVTAADIGYNANIARGLQIFGNGFLAANAGVSVMNGDRVGVNGNHIHGGIVGISFDNVIHGGIIGNDLDALGTGVTGISINNSPSILVSNNTIDDYDTGLLVTNSDNTVVVNNIFNNNMTGIQLDNSDNTLITGALINIAASGTGIRINDSSTTLVSSTTLNGGFAGIVIDGTGSMQFGDNNSFFNGNTYYFILQNGAMFGQTLDASQQTFDGTRAINFTLAQLNAAEGRIIAGDPKTIDGEDESSVFATLGDVFYKAFPPAPPIDFSALDEFQQDRTDLFRKDLFSYAGYTIEANAITRGIKDTNYNFKLAELDLNLLNRSASGIAAPQTFSVASNINPGDYGNLAPAAGGNFGDLSPAAGGVELSAGNDFLANGYKLVQ